MDHKQLKQQWKKYKEKKIIDTQSREHIILSACSNRKTYYIGKKVMDKFMIYRDSKPENLVLDSDWYLKVADFGVAKIGKDKTFTLCCSADYLCAKIVTGQGHNW